MLQTRLGVRSAPVRSKVALTNSVKGTLRSAGYRVQGTTLARFLANYAAASIPRELRQALDPLVETLVELAKRLEKLTTELTAEAKQSELHRRLQTVPGWLEASLEDYDRALRSGGRQPDLLAERAVAAAKLGRAEEARRNVDAALEQLPTAPEILYCSAQVAALTGDVGELRRGRGPRPRTGDSGPGLRTINGTRNP